MERVVSPQVKEDEIKLDTTLRPQSLGEFVGQERIKGNLQIFIDAAKGRGETIEHVLLYGNPGLGKTTLAHIIAKEMGANIKVTSGPALERVGDLAAILTSLETGDILFVDEIHRMNKTIEEVLYPALEDYALDIIIGKGPGARTLRVDLNRFTLIGATTKMSLLSGPLRDRFGAIYHLNYYEEPEIEQIVNRSSKILDIALEKKSAEMIASSARRTPRIANRLLKRVRDFAQVKGDGVITEDLAREALKMLEIDEAGLDQIDRLILEVMINKFDGGPVGLNTLAAATAEEIETIEEIYEPFLLQRGLINRTPRGRIVTGLAYKHLGLQAPTQQNLI
ncbi:MAG: Holliday junction ATP-dependent DNA helicase RuvB [Candidatus Magasanikbacteria bacterium GW2011_GWC2_40_17]|uniref:Holliday junction branch migration complex subunit RuvB n=1 Tax=Candidatus Magasanikbacteria bacterium GW2011_GWA2_42_32 TaxID=1619039 RepID=A0A0G1A8S7_9BACT|nr:MAG: Holliday junction ATP-dependent DNA helicase RuvB [Candidatus Magasanikbacteria bacterium GW2011_GWC2_40_17]KKS57329.1 MAG: Holliday junction ATP-dependent DNA helicase RuvB [Candidatus Magasanikbacteria bacterium GW2011_GWA2_42_32]OGH85811.1 MAG: Holliday junction DNA helicase RuvB [Candidatus Magasanikbacteria bacterium RIFOXYB2_FULL_38_10]